MNFTKFFVSNLPEGCTLWELRRGLEGYGNIVGTFDVLDRSVLEKELRGVKLGDSKLKVNIARFAMENSGFQVLPEAKISKSFSSGQNERIRQLNVRDGRSFRDVVGTSNGGGGFHQDSGVFNGQRLREVVSGA
ncbi:putative RNA-binding domain superfamily [Helianthus anomalus]